MQRSNLDKRCEWPQATRMLTSTLPTAPQCPCARLSTTYTSTLRTLQSMAERTLSCFLAYGMVKDSGPFNMGPSFISDHLKYTKAKNSTGGDIIEVSSATLVTPDQYFIQASAGMHYCKLLSPARVLHGWSGSTWTDEGPLLSQADQPCLVDLQECNKPWILHISVKTKVTLIM